MYECIYLYKTGGQLPLNVASVHVHHDAFFAQEHSERSRVRGFCQCDVCTHDGSDLSSTIVGEGSGGWKYSRIHGNGCEYKETFFYESQRDGFKMLILRTLLNRINIIPTRQKIHLI